MSETTPVNKTVQDQQIKDCLARAQHELKYFIIHVEAEIYAIQDYVRHNPGKTTEQIGFARESFEKMAKIHGNITKILTDLFPYSEEEAVRYLQMCPEHAESYKKFDQLKTSAAGMILTPIAVTIKEGLELDSNFKITIFVNKDIKS